MQISINSQQPFKNILVFSGGGLKFAYYLGIYQALCDSKQKPDLILAICGGTFVAGLLEICDDAQAALKLMLSKDFYIMLCRFVPHYPQHRFDYLISFIKRWLKYQIKSDNYSSLSTNLLEELKHKHLIEIQHENFCNPLWNFESSNSNINSIILACEWIEIEHQHFWRPVLRCSNIHLANLLHNMTLNNAMAKYNSYHIDKQHSIFHDMPLSTAIRASISDIFYLKPINWKNHTLMGGLINLTPIELATQLAHTVYIDDKLPYTSHLAEPAIKYIFGFNANQRLREVVQYNTTQNQIHWINVANELQKIPPLIKREFHFLQGYVNLIHPDFKTFQEIIKIQYKYGYQSVEKTLRNQ